MKILVVDDDELRLKSIQTLLNDELKIALESVVICTNAQKAKTLMRSEYFNILILDVMLPKRDETPSAQVGLDLLDEITRRSNINTPGRIFGITANKDDIELYRDRFEKYFFTVVEAGKKNKLWKRKVVDSINYALSSDISKTNSEKPVLCLSIHGIETRGEWQSKLKKAVRTHTNSVDFETYSYGFYSFIAFFLPFIRYFAVLVFERKLSVLMNKPENKNKELIIFAHSFGTYIAVYGIQKYFKKNKKIPLKRLVLAGSVLKSNYDFSKILEVTGCSIINDTGDRDIPLLISNLLVPFTGMAGRTGFFGFNNNKFVNRYFHGGHSHYFENDDFIQQYWLPLLSDSTVESVDKRIDCKFNQFIEASIRHLGHFKEFLYFILIAYFIFNMVN